MLVGVFLHFVLRHVGFLSVLCSHSHTEHTIHVEHNERARFRLSSHRHHDHSRETISIKVLFVRLITVLKWSQLTRFNKRSKRANGSDWRNWVIKSVCAHTMMPPKILYLLHNIPVSSPSSCALSRTTKAKMSVNELKSSSISRWSWLEPPSSSSSTYIPSRWLD